MQETALSIEREALQRLPDLLADLLDEESVVLQAGARGGDQGADLSLADSRGRHWLVEVKTSIGPGRVLDVAKQLRRFAEQADPAGQAIPLLVVPHMSEASARTAEEMGVNWLDLAGNASIRAENLHVWVRGRPNEFRSRGRPSSPFAPRSARVTRVLLLDPKRWWRQKDLVKVTGLDDGTVSRVVRRLDEERFLSRRGRELRPRDPAVMLDAWAEDYEFERHDIVAGHISGNGAQLARALVKQLNDANIHYAFTGLPAAWAIDGFARFRLVTVYVERDPRAAAEALDMRRSPVGANIQLVGPNDVGVFAGERDFEGFNCVAPVQVYLDLLHLPERAEEAAQHLRAEQLWTRAAA